MCFAPQADAVAGGVVIVVGVETLLHAGSAKRIPLSALPLLFGLHQLSEAFVWWGLQGHVSHEVERVAIWIYLLFALAALPIILPIAIGLVEQSAVRRRAIGAFAALGLFVGVALAVALFRGPITAHTQRFCVAYHVGALAHGRELTTLYVIATCGALLASSWRDLAALGAASLVVTPVLMWLTVNGFISLWCFWAAVMSIVIALHHRRAAARFALTR